MSWRARARRAPEPEARAGHTHAAVGGRWVIVIAGGDGVLHKNVWLLDTKRFIWSRMPDGGVPGRCAHTTNLVAGKLILFAGGNGQRVFNDIFVFNVDGQLSFSFRLLRVACGVWRVACGVWRVACGVWRVAEAVQSTLARSKKLARRWKSVCTATSGLCSRGFTALVLGVAERCSPRKSSTLMCCLM
jgi:hypothetical protein